LGGVLIIHVFDPILYRLFAKTPLTAREILALCLSAVFAADYVVSHFVLKLVKTGVEGSEADSSEQISLEVRMLLHDRSVFYRRFADAYPEVIYKTERISARMDAIRAETEQLRREAEQRLESGRDQLAQRLEPTPVLKSGLIEKQEALIALLYDEATATGEMKALKGQIDADLARLQSRRARM
jgi:hypothetical protein